MQSIRSGLDWINLCLFVVAIPSIWFADNVTMLRVAATAYGLACLDSTVKNIIERARAC